MAGSNKSVDEIMCACAIATQALEATGNLQCRDIRNLASLTATGSYIVFRVVVTRQTTGRSVIAEPKEDCQHLTSKFCCC